MERAQWRTQRANFPGICQELGTCRLLMRFLEGSTWQCYSHSTLLSGSFYLLTRQAEVAKGKKLHTTRQLELTDMSCCGSSDSTSSKRSVCFPSRLGIMTFDALEPLPPPSSPGPPSSFEPSMAATTAIYDRRWGAGGRAVGHPSMLHQMQPTTQGRSFTSYRRHCLPVFKIPAAKNHSA